MTGDAKLGARIRQRLREMDRDQKWLARLLGKDPSTISRWLDGSRAVSTADLREISLALQRTPAWLLSSGTQMVELQTLEEVSQV